MRRGLAWVVGLAAVSGCGAGGDRLTPERYVDRLDRACAAAQRETAQLPRLQQEENLSLEQLAERAKAIGTRFGDQVDALRPPAELDDAADQVRDRMREQAAAPRQPAALVAALERTAASYERVGATGCREGLQRTIAQLRSAP